MPLALTCLSETELLQKQTCLVSLTKQEELASPLSTVQLKKQPGLFIHWPIGMLCILLTLHFCLHCLPLLKIFTPTPTPNSQAYFYLSSLGKVPFSPRGLLCKRLLKPQTVLGLGCLCLSWHAQTFYSCYSLNNTVLQLLIQHLHCIRYYN